MADAFKPTLAVVFISIKQDRQEICELLDQEGIAIFGSTTAGEIMDGEIGQGSVAILLLDINRTLFKILFAEAVGIPTREIARDIGQSGVNTFSNPAFIVACGGLLMRRSDELQEAASLLFQQVEALGVPAMAFQTFQNINYFAYNIQTKDH